MASKVPQASGKTDTKFRLRLYTLTSLACLGWMVQDCIQSVQEHNFLQPANLFLLACILVMVLYTGISALKLWKASRKEEAS